MTVKELIERLKDFPDDAEVFVYDHEWGYFAVKDGDITMEEEIVVRYDFTDKPDKIFNNVVVI